LEIISGIRIVETTVLGEPLIFREGSFGGRRVWIYYIETIANYKSEYVSDDKLVRKQLFVRVFEQDPKRSKNGLAIDDIEIK
jgi:hypothetical protein